jgi:hypothetical protein
MAGSLTVATSPPNRIRHEHQWHVLTAKGKSLCGHVRAQGLELDTMRRMTTDEFMSDPNACKDCKRFITTREARSVAK